MIEIKSLYKSFGSKKVLKNINLCFNTGEVVGIVGENGAGKTTLFNCLIGLEDYQGEINYSNKSLKNVTGFLSTDPFFLSKMTGLEYLQLLCNARNIKHTSFKEKNIFDLPLNQYAETYSTGMKKKLALLGILLQQNEIFILDEPFNGVDIHNNILIQELIHKLKSLNKIVILSSHIFSTLEQTCDYLHYLKDGEIVKSVDKSGFADVEEQMKGKQLANIIDNIGLI